MKPILLFLQIFLNFLQFSICNPYKWDPMNLANNVHKFAEFMDKLYKNYRDEHDKMDTILVDPPMPFPQNNYSEKQKRTVFNFTFVKCAAEIAHFRVISQNENSKDAYEILKMGPRYKTRDAIIEFVGFVHFDQSLGHKINEKFKNEFFNPKEEIAKSVVNQIMQLTFSFAVRVILCIIYGQSEDWYDEGYFKKYHKIGGWQLKTLLSAYKSLSGESGGANENGIFPFQIIQIDENGSHFWAQFLCPKQNLAEEILKKQQQYIRNFKFILELSDKKITYGEIEKVIETIMSNKKKSPLAIYKFIEEKFTSFLSLPNSSSSTGQTRKFGQLRKKIKYNKNELELKMDCALANFGQELAKRLPFIHFDFEDFVKKNKKHCGKDAFKKHDHKTIGDNNTPAEGCHQLEMELFSEPLWNYVRVIEIDMANEHKEVIQHCNGLRTMVNSALEQPLVNKNKIESLRNFHHFLMLKDYVNDIENYGNSEILQRFEERFENYKTFAEKNDSLKELLEILDKIQLDYSRINSTEIITRINPRHSRDEILRFGPILYETLKMNSNKVKYDEKKQLLTFPLTMGERIIIRRLSKFIKRNFNEKTNIGDDIDFAKAIQTVASSENELLAEKRQVTISQFINLEFLKLFFTLAIRLLIQIGRNDLIDQHLPSFLFSLKMCRLSDSYSIFIYKINIDNEMVQLNIPNWHLPYSVYLENEKELIDENKRIVNFVRTPIFELAREFSNYSPTVYKVIKMANILNEMNEDGQILISPSNPKVLNEFLKYLNKSALKDDDCDKTTTVLPINGQFCILSHFVLNLLEKANEAEYLPDIDFVEIFVQQTIEKCTDERIKKEANINLRENIQREDLLSIGENINEIRDYMVKYGENIMNIGKATKVNFNFKKDIEKYILPVLIAECEDPNYKNLSNVKMVEWKMLEMALDKIGESEKWKQIETLYNKWATEYEKSFNVQNFENVKKVMEKMKKKLEELKEVNFEVKKENEKKKRKIVGRRKVCGRKL